MGKLLDRLHRRQRESAPEPVRLTILHSNDIHGDFLAEETDGQLTGGVSRLSGYVNQVRQQEEHVLYAIAGDFFRGSVIDGDYRGISTIEILNALGPDVVTLGNHEADYGLGHLLFLEKCASFPMINANLHVKQTGERLFPSHVVLERDGMRILFIGLLNESILAMTRKEALIGNMVDITDPAESVGQICSAYGPDEVDLTVLLTHIGFEEDQMLAEQLDPAWGVDLIIGGHSHTLPDGPACVNGILIVQAGYGTDQIGRLDLVIDRKYRFVDRYEWQAIPITDSMPRDLALEQLVYRYKTEMDAKYNRVLTRFQRALTHPFRHGETELGNLCADLLADALGLDLMLMGSGSLRCQSMGPVVTYGDLLEAFPFDDDCSALTISGGTLKRMLAHMLREEGFTGRHTEFYQVSRRLRCIWSRSQQRFLRFELDGMPLADDRIVTIGLQRFHLTNFPDSFGMDAHRAADTIRVVSPSCTQVLEAQLLAHNQLTASVEGRIQIDP